MTITNSSWSDVTIESPFDAATHHLTPYPTDPQEMAKLHELRSVLQNSGCESYQQNLRWCNDLQLARFLIARKYDVKQAYDLLMTALEWRSTRRPDQVEQTDGWAERMGIESATGKIYNPGFDQYGRAIVVFDNTVQNTTVHADQMTLLAWSLELAIREMAPHTDKYLIFIHLENFSLFNNPSVQSSRETMKMLVDCFPERLGHLVCYRPPWIFGAVFEAAKAFIDPKTASKIVFVNGDDKDGSENDKKMHEVIGPNWKVLTGAGQPRVASGCSPGYNHAVFWPKLVDRVKAVQAREASTIGAAFAPAVCVAVPLPLPVSVSTAMPEQKLKTKISKSD